VELVRTCLQDLRYALRNLLKSRGFTAVAVLTLTIGIGANTAVFSIIDTILLRPLPYRDSHQLVRLFNTESAPGQYPFAGEDYLDWKAQNRTLQGMSLFSWPRDLNLSGQGQPDHVLGVPVEANFFSILGVNPLIGRAFAPGEGRPGSDRLVILSYGLWRSHFAADPAVVGRTLALDSRNYTVIGVMPADFRFPSQAQLWTPQDMDPKILGSRGSHWASAIGRLKPGATVGQAQADLSTIAARLEKAFPDTNYKVGASVVSLHENLVGKSRDSLLMMLSAVGLVLLIACANVANLLLSRAVARQKEMAVRSALGATRPRLVRQLLTESLALGILGGLMGLFLAWMLVTLFARANSSALPQFNIVEINGTVLAFAFGLAVATGALFGMFPALRTSGTDFQAELKGGAGSSISPGRRRRYTSDLLVVGEIALSLLLLVSAGLLLKDFARLRTMDIGVRPEGVLTAAVQLPEAVYSTPQQRSGFARDLLERTRSIAGVQTAAIGDRLPLEGGSNYYAHIRGRAFQRMSGPLVETHSVSPEYFRAMGVPVLKGRVFTPADIARAEEMDARVRPYRERRERPGPEFTNAVVYPSVINESMARHFWPDQDPIGQMFSTGNQNGPWREVIGVVADVRQRGLAEKPVPEAYDPFQSGSRLFLVLRSSLPSSAVIPQVRRALAGIDSSLPLFSVRTMDDVIGEHAQGTRFLSMLVGAFAALAALLAAIGIYGVLSYAVTQRTREIGIRMSLGASRGRVLGEIVLDGMRLTALGFIAGIAGALAAGRLLTTLLHEVRPRDPAIFIATAGLLAAVALLACYLPARRAARLDPTTALRYE
jgi:putative ABC transport system permease protein